MAMKCGLFDSTAVEKDVEGFPRGNKAQDAAFFARYFSRFVGSGVCMEPQDGFALAAGGGTKVVVRPGEAFLCGYFCYDDEEATFDLGVSEVEREVQILLRLDSRIGEITLKALGDAQAAYLPVREGGVYDLVLGCVMIPAGCKAITQDMIEDWRANTAVCGYVRTLCYGGADRFEEAKKVALAGGCVGTGRSDFSADTTITVSELNMNYAKTGILPVACGGTGGVSAAAARANLGAAALLHTTDPTSIEPGEMDPGVVATAGVDGLCRLRNIALAQSLPASLPNGSICLVYGESGKGTYLFVSGNAVKIGGI